MIVSIIVAASENNVIGRDNQLLWHLPEDMKFFKNTTWGMPVIMGRKTYESMGKALPGRINIVVTRQQAWAAENVFVAAGIPEALKIASATNCKECFIIGGGEIYRQVFDKANRIYLTRVHAVVEGDTYFPGITDDNWELISAEDRAADEKNVFGFSFQKWQRKYSF